MYFACKPEVAELCDNNEIKLVPSIVLEPGGGNAMTFVSDVNTKLIDIGSQYVLGLEVPVDKTRLMNVV
jgi:hypothetical protein